MSIWKYIEPKDPERGDWSHRDIIISDAEILLTFYPFWSRQMLKVGKSPMITEDNCIRDFVIVNWAERVSWDG